MPVSQQSLSRSINATLRRVPAWPIYIIGAAWAGWLFYLGLTGGLGPEPINALERRYGEVALQLLVAGLFVTPLRTWTGVNLVKFRRALGLTAFFYVLAHFLVWAVLDLRSLARIGEEIVKRPYITIGFAAFLLLIPLALTSNNISIKRLGAATWRKLHRLTYPAVLLGAIHYIWLVKGYPIEPFIYAAVIVGLLLVRLRWTRLRSATA
ncbi:protein-methionine-sulfoxide reductase heme-binding subunit MsrQ [Pararhodobacter oceanensis]|uniref:Protein-methionine-sulfoxide reductase heme-binding subunit MsrQ n=1 Tax=Pararhodobacter oceanensis TaxID=2172121 RepID=A0A2T8HTX8_9RHOB|nr:protein-methionine-sulfoxide reductase heme-binding subunit MsrQ [Pararhodobacter oceanensis]PVH28897.1 protein-methionine-sulfoxide reductase heme-binding subunit MsrQ [Pararhodobacter oceanensis]